MGVSLAVLWHHTSMYCVVILTTCPQNVSNYAWAFSRHSVSLIIDQCYHQLLYKKKWFDDSFTLWISMLVRPYTVMCSGLVGGSGDYILEKVPQTRQDQVTFLYSRYSRKSQIRAHSYILYRLSGWLHTVYYSLAQTTPITWLTSEQWPWPGLEVNSLKIVTAQLSPARFNKIVYALNINFLIILT